jgi:hypothetical protein
MKTFKGYVPDSQPEFLLQSPDESRSLTVVCRHSIPGTILMGIIAALSGQSGGGGGVQAMNEFFAAAMSPEMHVEFREFCDEPDNGISVDMLTEIASFLVEEFTSRPTRAS